MRYQPDEYDLERSHELERRLDRDAEREPYGWRQPRSAFRRLPPITRDAGATLSYIAVREAAQGRLTHHPIAAATEGRAATRSGHGPAQRQSARGARAGAVPGVAA